MAVAASDIKFYLSGGSGNTLPSACLGGAPSTTEVNGGTPLNNLFDDVSDVEAAAGDTEYRCFYVKNTHGTDSLSSAAIYIASNTPSADTALAIGLDPAGVSANGTTIANESTAPAGVTFSAAANSGAALAIGTLGPGDFQAIWVRRVVDADAVAAASDPTTFRVTGTP